MNHTPCPHASSGCNAPEGECEGTCMTKKKLPEALRLSKILGGMRLPDGYNQCAINDSATELCRLHALCEEQKRLLEQARDALQRAEENESWISKRAQRIEAHSAITNHLLQHEGEKHDSS